MADKSWKAWERRCAKYLGGERRGADYGDMRGGKNDLLHQTLSVECKLLARPTYQQMLDACRQAEAAVEHPGQTPIGVIKRKRDRDDDALVVMRLRTYRDWFVE
jgi:hypothetical protein